MHYSISVFTVPGRPILLELEKRAYIFFSHMADEFQMDVNADIAGQSHFRQSFCLVVYITGNMGYSTVTFYCFRLYILI